MEKAFQIFDKCLKVILGLMTVAMIVIGSLQVIFRYVLQAPLTWSEESIRYIFVWTTFLGIPIGVARNGHASFDILEKRVPVKVKPYYQIVLLMLAGIMFLVFIVYGIPFALKNLKQYTPALHIPYAWVSASVPVGGFIGVIYTIHTIKDVLPGRKGGQPDE